MSYEKSHMYSVRVIYYLQIRHHHILLLPFEFTRVLFRKGLMRF